MKNKKLLWISLGAAALAALGIGGGIWYSAGHRNTDPIYVYDFSMVGMTDYWGDQKESYGPVGTDRIQTIVLSDTQTITEVMVQQGDEVKKGDMLMSFDTTLSDLALERKRLEVEKQKLQLEDDQARLQELNNMRPMMLPNFTYEPPEPSKGDTLKEAYKIYPQNNPEFDGSSKESALMCWISNTTPIDRATVLEAVRKQAEDVQRLKAELAAKKAWEEAVAAAQEAGEEPPEYVAPTVQVKKFYVVFKQTEDNTATGTRSAWQGMYVDLDASSFALFNAADSRDFSVSDQNVYAPPEIDYGSGYTAAQLATMRKDQEKKIRETEFAIKMAESEYKIMQTEVTDGNIYAKFDGKVVSLLTEEEAKLTGQAFMKVSGGGGFTIDCSVSELDKEQMEVGQPVTVIDYQTGMSYEGKVTRVGDYPTTNGYYDGSGNPMVSYYPFDVFVDETADLVEGNYVSVQYSLGEDQKGIYLENPFLRTEDGQSYVYVQGANGKLERRDVVVGKSLWGSYTEIRGGLTVDDKVAFPYGKNVKLGASVKPGDYSTMYG